jgi:hypothetical protein
MAPVLRCGADHLSVTAGSELLPGWMGADEEKLSAAGEPSEAAVIPNPSQHKAC